MILLPFILLFILYASLVLYYAYSWSALPVENVNKTGTVIKFSIVIAARNEENNIGALIDSLHLQDYPADHFEIIVVDDHSVDHTASIAQLKGARLITLVGDEVNSFKKKAIEAGITAAGNEWIITTDADCLPGPLWLSGFASTITSQTIFLAAPVKIHPAPNLIAKFQAVDFMILQTITGAVARRSELSMCNGANIAYRKEAFFSVNGFQGIDQIASGDDMLLMHKISKRFPGGVKYLKAKELIVETKAVNRWKEFFSQRVRWASKARSYQDKRIFPVLLVVYLFNISLVALAVLSLSGTMLWWYPLIFLGLKVLIELPLFFAGARFFKMQKMIGYFIVFQPMHVLYTVLSGTFGQFGTYEWKGRRVK
jgi:biofilm PGA synthesis N-glycosyltransferase PgaC